MGAHCTRQDGVELAVSGHGRELLKRHPTSVHLPHTLSKSLHCWHGLVPTLPQPRGREDGRADRSLPSALSYGPGTLRHYSTLHYTT